MPDRLQYISQGATVQAQVRNIQHALDAGCTWIQLRFKDANKEALIDTAEQAKKLCASYKAIFIINDHVDVAKNLDADGVHLGLDDMPVRNARDILGAHKIFGGTANTLEHVIKRVGENCNYIGLGPFRFTATKEKLSPIVGLEGFKSVMKEVAARKIHIPVFAIGGIMKDDIEDILQTGVSGIAVSGAITNDLNARRWIQNINAIQHEKLVNS
jgi:thiamine-phosphate pyrophosphorylase